MYSAEVTEESRRRCPSSETSIAGNKGRAANAVPASRSDLIYLDSLLMTLMRAPFSSFSL
ncbi:hypothetical protein I79_004814 [Cricetulus griseus]|uniref:Uncharacterized protein n=1 Tax=Cricetulus griseus TaxID=10029 RepID=G3H3M5_CRIGR|nr:hypothetical protein I79_004814 [Cricetulus griseus]